MQPTPTPLPASRPLRTVFGTALVGLCLGLGLPARAQQVYPTPEAAAAAFFDALSSSDGDALKVVLGRDYARVLPARATASEDSLNLLAAKARHSAIVPAGSDRAFVEVGNNGWTLPIPLARRSAGWSFDTAAAPEEMRVRRVGRNELSAIQVVQAIGDAQQEYAALDADGDGVKSYAARLLSSPGKRDGLYWPTLPGEAPSPLGPLAAHAKPGEPFHGYLYRVLSAQGGHASGGAKSYLQGGRLNGGFGVVAWPAKYGQSGVLSFIAGPDGVVHEKDLGPQTDAVARRLKAYDPDPSWHKAPVVQ